MSLLSHPVSRFNHTTDFDAAVGYYAARPSGHLDEGMVFVADESNVPDAMELDRLDHQQAIDCGDRAVADDAAMAELTVLARVPAATMIHIDRLQKRRYVGGVTRFETNWCVVIHVGEMGACSVTGGLDNAVEDAIMKMQAKMAALVSLAAQLPQATSAA